MTLAADAPKQGFRLGMLIYDTRYRSITIQIVVLILALVFVGWLADNTMRNLAQKGKDIDFSFLWRRAGYDIGQHMIPYTNDSPHIQAALVGLTNTLVVAVLASILSTVLGVVLGVLRLSKNWIVSRLVGVYVEIFRNIPLLLWIVLIGTVFSETLPQPKDFKVVDGVAKAQMALWDSVAMTNRSTNIPMPLLERPLPPIGGILCCG